MREAEAQAALRQAAALHQGGRGAAAEAEVRRVLARLPRHPGALHLAALLAHARGEHAAALRLVERALQAAPDDGVAEQNRGAMLEALGRRDTALAAYTRARALQPRAATPAFNQGRLLHGLGRHAEAAESLAAALALAETLPPAQHTEAHRLRAHALIALHRGAEALAHCRAVLAATPESAMAHADLGTALNQADRHEEAVAALREAVARAPDFAAAWGNLAYALARLDRHHEAIEAGERALALQPGHPLTRFNLGFSLLALGEYERGWAEYEARWEAGLPDLAPRMVPQPGWTGAEDLAGRTILVHAEQGHGDTIQFCRYVPMLAARGARVIVETSPAMAPLLRALPGAAAVVAQGEALPPFDLHVPLLSLPRAFGTTPATVPRETPYLHADPARVAVWQERLGPATGLRVGLAWSGRPEPRGRAIPLAQLAPLARPGVELISVQKEVWPRDRAALDGFAGLRRCGEALEDFADAAALVACLDLVISIDTVIAHLAGALARPVWVLLSIGGSWQWSSGRAGESWYPTARLYKQTQRGNWEDVIAAVARDLDALTRAPASDR